jgi:hypothetical protein
MAVLYRRNFSLSISYAMKADFHSFARKTKPDSTCDDDKTTNPSLSGAIVRISCFL